MFSIGDVIKLDEFIGRVTGMYWEDEYLVYHLEELRNGNRPLFGYYESGRLMLKLDVGILNRQARVLSKLEELILLGADANGN